MIVFSVALSKAEIKGDVVYRDESVVAFRDIRPKAPVHILIIPRKHVATILDLDANDQAVIGQILLVIAKLAREQGIAESGFRVVVNSGADAGQTVFHLHFHLLGGRPLWLAAGVTDRRRLHLEIGGF